MSVLAFQACQFSTDDPPVSMTGQKSLQVSVPEGGFVPDQAKSYLGADTLATKGEYNAPNYTITTDLVNRLDSADTLEIHLCNYGVVTTLIRATQNADGSLKIAGAMEGLDRGRSLVRLLDGTNYQKSTDGAIKAYASRIFAKDPNFQGFPSNTLLGIDTGMVMVELLRLAVKDGRPLDSIVESWGMILPLEETTRRILSLEPRISSSDSARLFPPPPVRPKTPVSLSSAPKSRGETVSIVGSFEGDADLSRATLAIFKNGIDVSSQFNFFQNIAIKSGRIWNLGSDNTSDLMATNAEAGDYSLKITVTDALGRSGSIQLDFTVGPAADATPPSITFLAPSVEDTVVDRSTSSFDVQITAEDASGIDSVTIDGTKAQKNDQGRYHRTVVLDSSGTPTRIEVVATDKAGKSSSKTIRILRKALPGESAPVFRLVTPESKTGTVLPFDSAILHVTWTVVDESGIVGSSVKIRGATAIAVDDSTWMADLAIPATGEEHTVTLEAKNGLGKGGVDYFTVVRKKDAIAPRIAKRSGDRTVAFDSVFADASWIVSDNHRIESVTIQGSPVAPRTDGIYSIRAKLAVDTNELVVRAVDSTGNAATDTIRIVRENDKQGPRIQIVHPMSDLVLDYSTTKVAVQVRADDPSGIDSVLIQKILTDSVSGEYRREIAVPSTGFPTGIAIRVVDKKGNASDTIVRVTRRSPPDDVVPTMSLLAPSSIASTIVPFDSTGIVVRWKIVDPFFGVNDSSVRIANLPATKENDSVWSLRVPLKPTGEPIAILASASNRNGKRATELISVTRRRDTIAPSAKPWPGNIREVPFDSSKITIGWDATDNHKVMNISINGIAVVQSANTASKSASLRDTLVVGRNVLRILVTDSFGNTTADSFAVTRLADAIAPRIAVSSFPAAPIAFARTTTVAFSVQDNDTVSSVTINGRNPVRRGDVYSLTIDLDSGKIPVVVIAKDRQGARTSTSNFVIDVELKDRDGNIVPFKKMPDGRIWTTRNIQTKPSSISKKYQINVDYCIHENCEKFGRNYSWAMAMEIESSCDTGFCTIADSLQHQGLCMSGFHVPSKDDWRKLLSASAGGGSDSLGISRLKSAASTDNWGSASGDHSGTDLYGFTIVPLSVENEGTGIDGAEYWLPTTSLAISKTRADVLYVTRQSRFSISNKASPDISTYFRAQNGALRCIAN